MVSEATPAVEPYNILIVEDDEDTAELISANLRTLPDVRVETADSREEALRIKAEKRIDIVVLDLMLRGGVSGIEGVTQMVSDHDGPVLICSGVRDRKMQFDTGHARTMGYVVKPASGDMQQLVDQILASCAHAMGFIDSLRKEKAEAERTRQQLLDQVDEMKLEIDRLKGAIRCSSSSK